MFFKLLSLKKVKVKTVLGAKAAPRIVYFKQLKYKITEDDDMNNNNVKENRNIYIRTLEATDIYNHLNRERELKEKYIGMLPFSLELIKLKKLNFKTKVDKITGKEYSDDIINVKFNQKVRSSKDLIKLIKKKIVKLEEKLYDIEKTQKYIDS